MKNIVITGFMATGKTIVGKIIAERLGLRFIDMDKEIEREEGMKISERFEKHGEKLFRERETEMAKRLSEKHDVVIATGGGVVLKEENMEYLKKNGIIICLMATPEEVYNRTKNNKDRPLLNVDDLLKKIKELLDYRMPFYQKADLIIETGNRSPVTIVEEIFEAIREKTVS